MAKTQKQKLEEKIKNARHQQKIETDYVVALMEDLSRSLTLPLKDGGDAKYSLIWLKKSVETIEEWYTKEVALREESYRL